MYKIAVTSSGPLSGKTTLAKYLSGVQGFTHVDHSLSIVKEFVKAVNANTIILDLTVEMVYKHKEEYRQQLQRFGDYSGFNDSSKDSVHYWIDKTLEGWDGESNVVYEPFRGEKQAEYLRELGFMLVQVEIGERERKARAEAMGKSYSAIQKAVEARPDLELGIEHPTLRVDGTLPVEKQAEIIWVAYDLFSRSRGGEYNATKL